jgi:hypothetical protein
VVVAKLIKPIGGEIKNDKSKKQKGSLLIIYVLDFNFHSIEHLFFCW